MTNTKQDERTPVYTEGICGDGAMILRDGQPFPISSAIDALNAYTSTEALRSALAGALDALEFSRAQLKEYELAATREDYNSPTINVAIDEARAALSGSPAPSTEGLREWMPIETAPKAIGRCILLAIDGCVGEGYWADGDEGSCDQPPYEAGWCIPSLGMFNKLTPTHWMPLPPAPDAARAALAGVTAPADGETR